MQNKFIPNDFFTHQQSWRKALVIAEANAKVEAPDVDDKAYWQHELAAFDRAYRELQMREDKSTETENSKLADDDGAISAAMAAGNKLGIKSTDAAQIVGAYLLALEESEKAKKAPEVEVRPDMPMAENEPPKMVFLDRNKEKIISLLWQGECDGEVEAFDVNGMLVIPSRDGVTYVRREDAISFFGLQEPSKANLPGKILPQGSNSVNNLIDAGISSLTHLPDVHKTKMVQALNAFQHECVPAAVSFEDIDACIERKNLFLSVEEKINVMKGLIALSRTETAKEQIVDIANLIVLQRPNQSSEDFDPDATLPSMGSNY